MMPFGNSMDRANSTLSPGALATVIPWLLMVGCSGDSVDSLAPYEGHRPLTFLKITKSYTPEIQWLGGWVAAVGVNRGERAALDSSLVWLMTAEDNSIRSYVTVGTNTDTVTIEQFGGTPQDSLEDRTGYTFWLAEKEMFEAGLDTVFNDGYNFVVTTITLDLRVNGVTKGEKSGNELVVTMTVFQNESLAENQFILGWSPDSIAFRQIAIRKGKTIPGWDNLEWHILTPDSLEDNVYPPVVLGAQIEGTDVVIPWTAGEFERNKIYTVWMSNSKWTPGNFSMDAYGLAFFTFRF